MFLRKISATSGVQENGAGTPSRKVNRPMKVCSQCDAVIGVDVSDCPWCSRGVSGRKPVYSCRNCGGVVPSQTTVCPQCGALEAVTHEQKCDRCGRLACLLDVEFKWTAGILVAGFHGQIGGSLCRDCIRHEYRRCTLINLLAEWWGISSFFRNLVYLELNQREYNRIYGMPSEIEHPPGAE